MSQLLIFLEYSDFSTFFFFLLFLLATILKVYTTEKKTLWLNSSSSHTHTHQSFMQKNVVLFVCRKNWKVFVLITWRKMTGFSFFRLPRTSSIRTFFSGSLSTLTMSLTLCRFSFLSNRNYTTFQLHARNFGRKKLYFSVSIQQAVCLVSRELDNVYWAVFFKKKNPCIKQEHRSLLNYFPPVLRVK